MTKLCFDIMACAAQLQVNALDSHIPGYQFRSHYALCI